MTITFSNTQDRVVQVLLDLCSIKVNLQIQEWDTEPELEKREHWGKDDCLVDACYQESRLLRSNNRLREVS